MRWRRRAFRLHQSEGRVGEDVIRVGGMCGIFIRINRVTGLSGVEGRRVLRAALLAPESSQVEADQLLWSTTMNHSALGHMNVLRTMMLMMGQTAATAFVTQAGNLSPCKAAHLRDYLARARTASTNLVLLAPVDGQAAHLLDRGKQV